MILLFGAAALLFAGPGPKDSTSILAKIVTPTISRSVTTGIRGAITADSIVVEKSKRTLTLFQSGIAVRVYQVALGKDPLGDKVKKGDGKTPEGVYFIDFKNPQSKYHKALHISYPDAFHAQRANSLGVSPGGDIMIHGLPKAFSKMGAEHRNWDWTEGCIAVTDQEIEEIWSAIPTGAKIQIKP